MRITIGDETWKKLESIVVPRYVVELIGRQGEINTQQKQHRTKIRTLRHTTS